MVGSPKNLHEKKQSASINLTDTQFDELKKLLQDYLKITAMAAIREINENSLERNARILNTAGFTQSEIGRILHVSQPTIARILTGVWKQKEKKVEQK